MNRDKGVFLLSHVYDDLLLSAATTTATPSGELSVRKRRQLLPKFYIPYRTTFADASNSARHQLQITDIPHFNQFAKCWPILLARTASRCRRAYILPMSFFPFFRRLISAFCVHWMDLNQTWTHIHLWLLFLFNFTDSLSDKFLIVGGALLRFCRCQCKSFHNGPRFAIFLHTDENQVS